MSIKNPTYKDLYDYIGEFVKVGIDIRFFFRRETNSDDFIIIGKYPVQKQYNIQHEILNTFILTEIENIKNQQRFDKTVKPYPDRDIYYNILIHDLNDLHKLHQYWFERHNRPIERSVSNIKYNSESR